MDYCIAETNVDLTTQNVYGTSESLQNANTHSIYLQQLLEPTLDDIDDNANLMSIGGGDSVPVDVAPEPLRLDQINVDAAIAGIVQSEEQSEMPSTVTTDEPPAASEQEKEGTAAIKETEEPDPEDDLPLATLAKTLEQPKSSLKGVLKTKTYGLKKKSASNRSFKCPVCETWKSTTQRLNAHYRRRHPPVLCGICGRSFTLPSSLTRHMHDHSERLYHCTTTVRDCIIVINVNNRFTLKVSSCPIKYHTDRNQNRLFSV